MLYRIESLLNDAEAEREQQTQAIADARVAAATQNEKLERILDNIGERLVPRSEIISLQSDVRGLQRDIVRLNQNVKTLNSNVNELNKEVSGGRG